MADMHAPMQSVTLDMGKPSEAPKAGETNGQCTVTNNYNWPITVTAWDGFLSFVSSTVIQPKATVTQPLYISAGVTLYAWYGAASGCNWELGFMTVTMHFHERKDGIKSGMAVTFGAAAAMAG